MASASIPCTLELGGKAPPSCATTPTSSARRAPSCSAGFANSGQVCIARRARVRARGDSRRAGRARDAADARAAPGRPGAGNVDVGRDDLPAPDRHAWTRSCSDALGKGAALQAGGKRKPGKGPLLRAHRARRLHPRDARHARRDLRPHRAHHEGGQRRRSGRCAPTTRTLGLMGYVFTRDRVPWAAHRRARARRHRDGQRRAHRLRHARGALRRREGQRLSAACTATRACARCARRAT